MPHTAALAVGPWPRRPQSKNLGYNVEVIGTLGFAALHQVAANDNTTFRKVALLCDGMRVVVPARCLKKRNNELAACVSLVHLGLHEGINSSKDPDH